MEYQIAQKEKKNIQHITSSNDWNKKYQIEQEERVNQEETNKQHNEHTYNTLYA